MQIIRENPHPFPLNICRVWSKDPCNCEGFVRCDFLWGNTPTFGSDWSSRTFIWFCCNVLQCVVAWCSVLQCVAVCCSVLQYVAVCCSMLQSVAVCWSMLQSVVVCCSMMRLSGSDWSSWIFTWVCCDALQSVAECWSILQSAAVCCGLLHGIAVCHPLAVTDLLDPSSECVAVCCSVL